MNKTNLTKGANAFDISALAEGTYVVRILDGDAAVTKKIVVAK